MTTMLSLAFATLAALTPATVTLRDGAHEVHFRRIDAPGRRALRPIAVTFDSDRDARQAIAYVGAHAIVSLRGVADPAARLDALGVRPVRALMPSIGLWQIASLDPGEDGLALAARLAQELTVYPDLAFTHKRSDSPASFAANDPRYSGQWYLDRIAIEDAWAIERGSAAVTVVVVDSGCDATHPDLAPKLDAGRDVVSGDDDPTPDAVQNAHGTACAGLIGAVTNNDLGIAGVCPECRLRCVRLLADNEPVPLSADVDAFQFALDVDAAVVSNSWGFVDSMPAPAMLAAAIDEVHTRGRGGLGAFVVFAIGNDDRPITDDELTALPSIVSVGAVNNFGELTSYSNSGPSIDVVAPTGTLSTDIVGPAGYDPGDYTNSFGGTSSACPIVAGVAGLLVSAAPSLPIADLERALVSTAKQSPFATPSGDGHDDFYGFGVIVPAAALRVVKPAPPVEPPPASGCAMGSSAQPSPCTFSFAMFVVAFVASARRRLFAAGRALAGATCRSSDTPGSSRGARRRSPSTRPSA